MNKKTLSEILAVICDAIDTGLTNDLLHLSKTLESDHYKEKFDALSLKRMRRGMPLVSFEAFMEKQRVDSKSNT